MPANADHNRLIAHAAKVSLAPLGCMQKGRSRLWYDDHGWWVGVVEFQPSAWGKGSYLNVAAMWLWNAKDHWSFDEGGRVETFHEFEDESQFSDAAAWLAARAATEVLSLRRMFNSVEAAATHLAQKDEKGIWDHYHAAVSAALTGQTSFAQSRFAEVASARVHAPWVADLQAKAASFSSRASSRESFQQSVHDEVVAARSLLKLPPLQENRNLWASRVAAEP
jgi:hypothetical protein